MAALSRLPRLYPILDAALLLKAGISIEDFGHELHDAGARFLQYRDKEAPDDEVLQRATLLRSIFPASDCCLILNDRVRLAREAHFDGVHLGQDDMPPAEARLQLGPGLLLGLSTHGPSHLRAAEGSPVDYLAIGPVFATSSKQNPDPVIGLAGLRAARRITSKPLVAIGGITRANCRAVLEAGADSVSVISDLLPRPGESAGRLAREFLLLCGESGPSREL